MEKKEKNKVGRPRKTPPEKKSIIEGIKDSPRDPDNNGYELICCNPMIIKKLFSIIGQSELVICTFTKTALTLVCKNDINQTIIEINGSKMNRYYCYDDKTDKTEVSFKISANEIKNIQKKIKKDFSQIIWCSGVGELAFTTRIELKWHGYSNAWNCNKIGLAGQDISPEEYTVKKEMQDMQPDITFTMKHNIFRSIVDDTSNGCGALEIIFHSAKKAPRQLLEIKYKTKHQKNTISNKFDDLDKINFKNLKGLEIFNATFDVNALKGLIAAIPSDNILFKIDKKCMLITTTSENKEVDINILTRADTRNLRQQ